MARSWTALSPLLRTLIFPHANLNDSELAVVQALLAYEQNRLAFTTGASMEASPPVATGRTWAAYDVEADIPPIIEALRVGTDLEGFLRPGIVTFVRRAKHEFSVFAVDPALRSRLVEHDPTATDIFERPASSSTDPPPGQAMA